MPYFIFHGKWLSTNFLFSFFLLFYFFLELSDWNISLTSNCPLDPNLFMGQNLGQDVGFREVFDVAVARAVAEMRILGIYQYTFLDFF